MLLECLKSRNLQQLKDVLFKMPEQESRQYLDRLLKSGLLVANDIGDNEEEAKKDEESGTEHMEK
jgi:hypothetical protein